MTSIIPIYLAAMAILLGLFLAIPVQANEIEAEDRLFNKHQNLSIQAARKLHKLRQQYKGKLHRVPATLVVPLIDQALRHMQWAEAYAPNEELRSILEHNAHNLKRLRARIIEGQTGKKKKGVCTGNDRWITV